MKNYSSNRAQKGKTAYRTPSRWKAGQPEKTKRVKPILPWRGKETTKSSYFGGRHQ